MPTYEYVCSSCGNAWEEVQRITEGPIEVCPKCGKSTAKRQISAGNFILKGGGWYADLYSSSKPKADGKSELGSTAPATGADGDKAKSETKTETKSEAPAKTETKSETKTETKPPPKAAAG